MSKFYLRKVGLVGVASILTPKPLQIDGAKIAPARTSRRRGAKYCINLSEIIDGLQVGVVVAAALFSYPVLAEGLCDVYALLFVPLGDVGPEGRIDEKGAVSLGQGEQNRSKNEG